ncbi:MAG: protein disulfide oxidoreductase [Sulfolobales archaeon]
MYGFKVDFDPEEREALREALLDMRGVVEAQVFISDECEWCDATVSMLKTISEASPTSTNGRLFRYSVYRRGEDLVKKLGVTRFPTIYLLNGSIRYYGIPAGEEIRALVETIIRISQGESGLEPETIKRIKEFNSTAVIETIVTPSCPYCPYAVLLANMVAFESFKAGKSNIVSVVVEAYENMDIAERYAVTSVPTIAINERVEFIGVPYEDQLLDSIYRIGARRPSRAVTIAQKATEEAELKKLIKKVIEEIDKEENNK